MKNHKKQILVIIFAILLSPLLGFTQFQETSKELPNGELKLFENLKWSVLSIKYDVDVKKQTMIRIKDNRGKEFNIIKERNLSLNMNAIKQMSILKDIVDDFSSLKPKQVTYYITSSSDISVNIIPFRWDHSNIQFQNYLPRGVVFMLKGGVAYYSFRVMNEDRSALVYGRYTGEGNLNDEVFKILLANFGLDPALFETKIGSSINIWFGTGSLFGIAYDQQLYKGLHISVIAGVMLDIGQSLTSVIIAGLEKGGAGLQAGVRLSYYFVNTTGISPYLFIADLNSLDTLDFKYTNIFQLGFGLLFSTWFYIEGSYNLNVFTSKNNSTVGVGLRIPL